MKPTLKSIKEELAATNTGNVAGLKTDPIGLKKKNLKGYRASNIDTKPKTLKLSDTAIVGE